MSWTKKTWHRGGGDMPLDSLRYYRYQFREKPLLFFVPYKAKISLPFDDKEFNKGSKYFTRGDDIEHLRVLVESPFNIKGHSVMDWAYECVSTGQAEFTFEVDASLKDSFEVKSICTLHAKFGNKGIASLFKLTFG